MTVNQLLMLNAVQGYVTTANPTYTNKTQNNLSLDTSGGLRVHIIASDIGGGGGTSSSFAAAFPASGTAIGVKNGLNMVNLTADASNNLNVNVASFTGTVTLAAGAATIGAVNLAQYTPVAGRLPVDGSGVTQPVSGTVTANQGGTWTVQPGNTANTTAWKVDGSAVTQPVSGTITANAGTNLNTSLLALEAGGNLATISSAVLAQGATTSGQKGHLIQGAVTTAAPTYTTAQTSPLSLTTAGALRVDGSGATQPVSGTVAATQSGTWTVQPGNTANTTAWKVDGSAVTQPVSGTVTANQGTANTAANAWFFKQTDGTNTSPTMDVAARAGFVELTDGTNTATVDATLKSLRVSPRSFEAIGVYSLNGNVAYTATTANGEILSFRWGDATRLCVLLRVRVQVVCIAFTTAGLVERQLIIQRANTVADTGGTAFVLTGNNNKRRTSFGTSLVSDVRIGGFLTAGTRTLDANPVASAMGWMAGVGGVIGTPGAMIPLYDISANDYPIVFAQNEGFLIRLGAAETASTRQTFVSIDWAEVNSF